MPENSPSELIRKMCVEDKNYTRKIKLKSMISNLMTNKIVLKKDKLFHLPKMI